ncbi:MAG: hypothetical protein KC620_23350, partial [Myxococcales bacterium]|nr:hypothetical protein [Myxococcales bacterium]
NQASRAAGLPYYLDPTVFFFRSAEGSGRHFRMRAHRVEAVHRYAAGGRDYATLHVRRMGGADGSTSLLGFSRDVQPFALVDLDEADDFETALASSALEDPPRCEDARRADGNEGLLRCGEVLAELLRADPRGLAPALIALTDRHELQHQIDGPHLRMASAVLDRLGHRSEALQDRVNRELSAYVAEMTTPAASPRLGLVHLVRFALNGDRGALFHIAVLAFEALGDTSLVDEDARLDRSALTATFVRLAALDEDALRARAAEAWGDLYGGSLAEVTALGATTRP